MQNYSTWSSVVGAVTVIATPALSQCDSMAFSATQYPAGTGPTSAAFGDVDGDQLLDLAVSDPYDETLSILRSTSAGGLASAVSVAAGRAPQAVALGDLDGDGDLDAAVCNRGIAGTSGWQDHGFTLLWNAGGAFTTSTFVALPATEIQPTDLELGDLDSDGDLDVVECLRGTGYLHSKVASFLNDGAGYFATATFAPTGYDPIALTLGDYDADGALDAVTSNYLGNSFSNLHGNGNGTFGTGYSHSTTYAQDSALGDFDGDGDLDLVVAYRYGLLVIRNVAGVFTWIATLPSGLLPVAVGLVDIDGDGDLDLASADQFGDALFIWRGDGTGAFTLYEQVAAGDGPVAIATGDIDGDGDTELGAALISGDVTLLDVECPLSTYCVAKLNSQGCAPAIGWTGTPSFAGSNDFHVVATSELNHKLGLVFFGPGAQSVPFAGGTMCVQPPRLRTPVQDSGGNAGLDDCSGAYDFHVSHAWLTQHAWGPGAELFAQWWSRDPLDAHTVALSNALRFTLEP